MRLQAVLSGGNPRSLGNTGRVVELLVRHPDRIDERYWWAIEVPELPGVFTQARYLDQAEEMVRDAIAAMLDVGPASVEATVEPVLEGDVA